MEANLARRILAIQIQLGLEVGILGGGGELFGIHSSWRICSRGLRVLNLGFNRTVATQYVFVTNICITVCSDIFQFRTKVSSNILNLSSLAMDSRRRQTDQFSECRLPQRAGAGRICDYRVYIERSIFGLIYTWW